jgi:hypothetical protein
MLRFEQWFGQHTVLIGKLEERGNLENVVGDGRIALQWIFTEPCGC